jgi:multidrug efflux system membrane fusion protein
MNREQGKVLGKWLGAGIVFCAVITGAVSTFEVDRHPRTDDATVRANGIAFAPEVEGRLVALYVRDNQKIHKGDLLFEIDPRPYEYALEQAKANQAMLEGQINDARRRIATEQSAVGTAKAGVLSSLSGVSAADANYKATEAAVERANSAKNAAEAQLGLAQNDYDRISPLLTKHYVTVQQVDQAQTVLHVAEQASRQAASQLLEAQAQASMALAGQQSAAAAAQASQSKLGESEHAVDTLETLIAQRPNRAALVQQASLNLEWCRVRSPFDGYVTNMNISQGAYAHPGTPMFTLIDTTTWWVLSNYRESRLRHIRPGMHVDVYLLERPSQRFDGIVDSVGRGVFPEDGGTAEGYPDVSRTLNWVHLSARFPVRIRIVNPNPELLRVGATAITVVR